MSDQEQAPPKFTLPSTAPRKSKALPIIVALATGAAAGYLGHDAKSAIATARIYGAEPGPAPVLQPDQQALKQFVPRVILRQELTTARKYDGP